MTGSPSTVPDKQRAWLAVKRGVPAQALRLDDNVPVSSELNQGEVLVKVQAAALNPVDYKVLGILPNALSGRPHPIGVDFSGVVVISKDTRVNQGDDVFGSVFIPLQRKTSQGTIAEYVRVPAHHVTRRPENITPTQAAGVSLVSLTATNALFDIAKLEPGQSLFINGGSTAVGLAAIQIAKSMGCKVTVTASSRNEELVKSLGVDVFIDYTKGPVHEALQRTPPSPKFHAILEAVGDIDTALFAHSEAYLAPGGTFVSVGPQPSGSGKFGQVLRFAWTVILQPTWLGGVKRKWALAAVKDNLEQLEYIAKLISEGKFKPVVDSVYAFEDALAAFDYLMTRRARGKIVIKVDPNAD